MKNYDPLRPTPSYGCHLCPAAFVSPNARLHHLEAVHGDEPDTSGAEAAVAQLHALLKRVDAKYGALPAKQQVTHE